MQETCVVVSWFLCLPDLSSSCFCLCKGLDTAAYPFHMYISTNLLLDSRYSSSETPCTCGSSRKSPCLFVAHVHRAHTRGLINRQRNKVSFEHARIQNFGHDRESRISCRTTSLPMCTVCHKPRRAPRHPRSRVHHRDHTCVEKKRDALIPATAALTCQQRCPQKPRRAFRSSVCSLRKKCRS